MEEALRRQQECGDKVMYLVNSGHFYRGYGAASFALHNLMGYQIVSDTFKSVGKVFYSGFPVTQMERVQNEIVAKGGKFRKLDGGMTIEFSGIPTKVEDGVKIIDRHDTTPHARKAAENEKTSADGSLAEVIALSLERFLYGGERRLKMQINVVLEAEEKI